MTLLDRLDAEIALCNQLSPFDPMRHNGELMHEAVIEIRQCHTKIQRLEESVALLARKISKDNDSPLEWDAF